MVYRPTVRYADTFKEYVDDLFHATDLDRNQIMRAALFSAAFSPSFESILKQYQKGDVPLPSAKWLEEDHLLWLEQKPSNKKKKGKNVYVNVRREVEITKDPNKDRESNEEKAQKNGSMQLVERREGKFPTERFVFKNQGGISIKIG
ncbi:hypothetical protein WQ54_14475 [Bacillus sp. SA1-12]|uniref:hypothetical protein n=1 Tax=Bacillus sp. SA1-12 TaxID=1455638 RepID=UPI000626A48A|nr:hypothetical protein [Bacillus sp. SA1-12]KKI91475.1 hypothetical protein WQ54_14475 [Bacillus sp. SA1-12]